ncbi:MAG TPA: 2-C-methyl-D-erythritol 2,4-cyclodiphosphate synthase [Patescibacteria group bacterium]|nr:2-C-methyl-D-erythritol 2,4-cyclodiphosphate synthase [Patescibacteria group bacterium]
MDRVGIGQDSHKFAKKKPLILGGVKVADEGGLDGNSDGDVILHSLCNALSSAIGGDSLSTWSDNMCKRGIKDSQKYVDYIFKKVMGQKYKVENVSISVEAKRPYIDLEAVRKMKMAVSKLLEIRNSQVGITFTSGEGLTPFGRGLGIAAICIVLLSK